MGSDGAALSPAPPPEEAAWPLSPGGNGGVPCGSGGNTGTGGRTLRVPTAGAGGGASSGPPTEA
eukprot:1008562-Alexandrium_andersonii.AAC.1